MIANTEARFARANNLEQTGARSRAQAIAAIRGARSATSQKPHVNPNGIAFAKGARGDLDPAFVAASKLTLARTCGETRILLVASIA